jgi:hypothetical protein
MAIRTDARLPGLMDFSTLPPALVRRPPAAPEPAPARRAKIWEFNTNLHCSIIGTCFSTTELRQVLKKLGVATQGSTDHELHGVAVRLAGRHDDAGRQLNKALDHRHKLAVSQFGKAGSEEAVRALWSAAMRGGDIPGAYWAALTHPAANHALVRDIFGDVHMLSHLVGSANRADIRRLCQLEAEKAALEAKLARQQQAFHAAVVSRDSEIRELRQALARQIVAEPAGTDPAAPDEAAALRGLVADLQKRLGVAEQRSLSLEHRLGAATRETALERAAHGVARQTCEAMRRELAVLEGSFLPTSDQPASRLDGVVVLYVGGRPNQAAHMRAVSEGLGATFLHHDGGIENHQALLGGLVSRSDVVLFPVDCVSHDAANAVKALCRQRGKRYVPLRTASVSALLAALVEIGPAGA